MPLLKIVDGSYFNEDAMVRVINYVCRSGYVGGLGVNPECAALQMSLVKHIWHKPEGRQIRHFLLSFSDDESIDLDGLMAYGYQIASYYYEMGYQIVFGVHTNTNHPHIHFAVNTVNFRNGYMYSQGWADAERLKIHIQTIIPQWHVILRIEKSNAGRQYR